MSIFAAASFGLTAVSQIAGFSAEKKQTKAERAYRDYANDMVRLSSLEDQNTLTLNEERARRASEASIVEVQANSLRAKGEAAVSAAVAGVTGQTVALQAIDIARNAASREKLIRDDFKLQLVDFDQTRKTASRRAQAGLDTSVIAGPSGVALAAGIGKAAVGIGKEFF